MMSFRRSTHWSAGLLAMFVAACAPSGTRHVVLEDDGSTDVDSGEPPGEPPPDAAVHQMDPDALAEDSAVTEEPDASSSSDTGSGGAGGSAPEDAGTSAEVGTPGSGPVLLVTGTDPQPAPDNGMKAELMALGLKFDFHNSDTMPLTPQTAAGHSLVIISPNTPHANVPASYKDLPIPIIVSKDGPAMQLGMANGPYTTANTQKAITIVAAGDPLAAGFPNGNVAVMGNVNRMVNGMPGPDAKVVATLVGNAKAATIYYYTAGQTMIGGAKAPAKRVGFFWHRTEDATPDGRKLFRAAVQWALQP
jgi:hypothetical protein